METTFDRNGDIQNPRSGDRIKNDLKEDVRVVKNSATEVKNAASDELKNFVSDIEDVIKRATNVSNADIARVRSKIQSAINSTRSNIESGVTDLKQQAQNVAKQTDTYVHERPWQAVGFAAAVGALLGLTAGYLVARR